MISVLNSLGRKIVSSIMLGVITSLMLLLLLGTIIDAVLQDLLGTTFRNIDAYAVSSITSLIIIAIIYTIIPHGILSYALDFSLLFTFIIIATSELTTPLCTYTGCEERYFLPFVVVHKFGKYYALDIDLGQIALVILLLRRRKFIAKLFNKVLTKFKVGGAAAGI